MPEYRRSRVAGGTYFFTVVTYQRQPFLSCNANCELLWMVFQEVARDYPFTVDAWVFLPDHLHCLWTLPEGDRDFSKRWGLIKAGFSKRATGLGDRIRHRSSSRQRHRDSNIWQRRFWEHLIRGDADCRTHLDYIHFNPVKHQWVKRVRDWPHSSFHRYVADGTYLLDWGGRVDYQKSAGFGE